jgi:hypothetical protein
MKDLKKLQLEIEVKSDEHFMAIQKRLIELGVGWWSGGQTIYDYKGVKFVHVGIDGGTMSQCGESLFYNDFKPQRITLDDLYSDEFLNEDTSNEDSFKKALPELESIVKEMFDAIERLKTTLN